MSKFKWWFKSDQHRLRWANKCEVNKQYNRVLEGMGADFITFRHEPDMRSGIQPDCETIARLTFRPFTLYEVFEFLEKVDQPKAIDTPADEVEPEKEVHEPFEFIDQVVDADIPLTAETSSKKKKKVKIPRGVKPQIQVHINKTVGSQKGARELIDYLKEVFDV